MPAKRPRLFPFLWDKDRKKSKRVTDTMLHMVKLDIATMKRAAKGEK